MEVVHDTAEWLSYIYIAHLSLKHIGGVNMGGGGSQLLQGYGGWGVFGVCAEHMRAQQFT